MTRQNVLLVGLFLVVMGGLFGVLAFLGGGAEGEGDDGTEVNGEAWYPDGYQPGLNFLGRRGEEKYDGGFRFHLEELNQGDRVLFARLRFASLAGKISSEARLFIEGVLQENSAPFSVDDRPSQKQPVTQARVDWPIRESWERGSRKIPFYYYSPDVSEIVNEILALPGWGEGKEGKRLAVTVRDDSESGQDNFVTFFDLTSDDMRSPVPITSPVELEIFTSLYDTFVGKEFLGRITDRSVTVNVCSLVDMDLFVEYGTAPGDYSSTIDPCLNQPGDKAVDLELTGLMPDTRYYYRLAYGKAGSGAYEKGEERTFHTQRPRNQAFTFAIQSDEHLQNMLRLPAMEKNLEIYRITLQNIAAGKPDFLISLGDYVINDFRTGRSASCVEEVRQRHLSQRRFMDAVTHSVPFFLTLGNHEGESGWFTTMAQGLKKDFSLICMEARKEFIPNPFPDAFYSGNEDRRPGLGYREDYFAWEWGDALFIVLDPFTYSRIFPAQSMDGWDWTLGRSQYEWLHETLQGSDAKWKLVFIHHLVSTTTDKSEHFNHFYGRGGIEHAKFKVAGNASFEWGGEDEQGASVFSKKRPGWRHGPIHDMLVEAGVSILFHGHDHCFVKQDLDGMVYQECPQPVNSKMTGYHEIGEYTHGDMRPNAGHLKVSVDPATLKVEYFMSFLPGKGENGKLAYEYILN